MTVIWHMKTIILCIFQCRSFLNHYISEIFSTFLSGFQSTIRLDLYLQLLLNHGRSTVLTFQYICNDMMHLLIANLSYFTGS
jgi:hypothetical protein